MTDLFFIERGGDAEPAELMPQRPGPLVRICWADREPCLAYALEHGERFGVWGGTSWQERRLLRRQQRAA